MEQYVAGLRWPLPVSFMPPPSAVSLTGCWCWRAVVEVGRVLSARVLVAAVWLAAWRLGDIAQRLGQDPRHRNARRTEVTVMRVTQRVRKMLDWYESDNPGTKANLARILSEGKLGGTGKLVILPVDQGFEHGPARSFAPNPAAYDPHYHFQLAIEAGLSAYAAPLGMIEAGAASFAGAIPTILKVNSANSLARAKENPSQA